MRSRAARLALAALACAALGVASFFVLRFEEQITQRRVAVRAFDELVADATAGLVEARAAQQVYVTPGQSATAWSSKVMALLDQTRNAIDSLSRSAVSPEAVRALTQAFDSVNALAETDRRVREYLEAGQPLMAADVLVTEASETAAVGSRHIADAQSAEHQQLESFEAAARLRQVYALGGGAAVTLLVLGWLALVRLQAAAAAPDSALRTSSLRDPAARAGSPAAEARGRAPAPSKEAGRFETLKLAAELCTELGRVNSGTDLTKLLSRAADALDAKGLVVWMCDPAGSPDLKPVLAHGYPQEALARMATVPRSADNAVAAAYRTGALQIVLARPGLAHGAIVAPLLAPEGCVGALTAEIRGGSETSEAVQALASLFAAQLTTVVTATSAAVERPVEGKAASA
jgi:hypothetical protein